ncbi:MAG: P1 family peptidase [Acidobacteriota bacterium]|nr:P1 family peptidase [Acidobacteriota bacterium]
MQITQISFALLLLFTFMLQQQSSSSRPRARDLDMTVGILPTGRNNAITDVEGVRVGHTTLIKGDNIRTGVTAILPHGGNLFQEKVPAAIHVGNGFGKLMGSTQVNELGEIETPILLASTLNVPRVADALLDWMLGLPGNEQVRSINPIVAETNDGFLNDIRGRHVGRDEVFAALKAAKDGVVEEGSVGAGTGTVAFGFKGGIGTSSRVVRQSLAQNSAQNSGSFTVGVLVQTNFGGVLTINGAPVGRELGKYYLKEQLEGRRVGRNQNPENVVSDRADGSIIMVVATDAPMDHRNLRRLAQRAMMGLARTGSSSSNGSGDYVIAFSTAKQNRIRASETLRNTQTLGNDAMSPLFQAVIEATEEAIYNSLLCATTVTGRDGNRVEALPIEKTAEILKKYGVAK